MRTRERTSSDTALRRDERRSATSARWHSSRLVLRDDSWSRLCLLTLVDALDRLLGGLLDLGAARLQPLDEHGQSLRDTERAE